MVYRHKGTLASLKANGNRHAILDTGWTYVGKHTTSGAVYANNRMLLVMTIMVQITNMQKVSSTCSQCRR